VVSAAPMALALGAAVVAVKVAAATAAVTDPRQG
jgi:hypothetical protein